MKLFVFIVLIASCTSLNAKSSSASVHNDFESKIGLSNMDMYDVMNGKIYVHETDIIHSEEGPICVSLSKILGVLVSLELDDYGYYISEDELFQRMYVRPESVQIVEGKPIIKEFHNIGLDKELRVDDKGYYLYKSELSKMKKGYLSYHYCNKCGQEFFTDRSFNNHDCSKHYDSRGGNRLFRGGEDSGIDHGHSEFDRNSEFNNRRECEW